MMLQRLLLPLLLFASGLCGVSYEILYGRLLANIIGDQFVVSAAVLLTFLLGIGCGALYAHRLWRGLWLIEAGIGVYAVAFAYSLGTVESWLYAALPGMGTSATLALLVAVLLLALPAFLIGVSLPLFAGYAQRLKPRTGYFASSYAVYNLGAAATVILVEFALVREVGIRQAVVYMGAVNALVAVVLVALYRPVARGVPAVEGTASRAFPRRLLLALVLAGIASAIFQLTAVRLAELLFGPYRETFAYVLCIVLLGIALGSALVNWLRLQFSELMLVNILCVGWMLGGLNWVMAQYALYYPQVADVYWYQVGLKFLCVAVLALGPSMTFGATIPALLNDLEPADSNQGRNAARSPGFLLFVASMANAAGFLLMTLVLHKRMDYGDLLVLVALLSAGSLVASGFLRRPEQEASVPTRMAPVFVAAFLAVFTLGGRAAWNEELLFQGHVSFKSLSNMQLRIGEHATSERYKGELDVLSISRRQGGSYFVINGKVSIRLESHSEKLVGAIGGVFSPDHRRALVLGVGSGATAGAVGLMFDEVEAIDISGVILDNLWRLTEHNFDIANRNNVRLIHDDAIHAVRVAEGDYSLILNTVTSPLFFSSSKLYTVEFLSRVREKLAPGGLYMTWLDSRVGDRGADIMLESVTGAFEHCGVAQIDSSYLLLLCSDQPVIAHHPVAAAEQPELARYFEEEHGVDPQGIAYQLLHTRASELTNRNGAPLNTLDFPVLEFEMAKLRERTLTSLQRRIERSIRPADLHVAFQNFEWSLDDMLEFLESTTGGNEYSRTLARFHDRSRALADASRDSLEKGDCVRATWLLARSRAIEGKPIDQALQLTRCRQAAGTGLHR